MSAPGWSTEPQSGHFKGLGGSLPDSSGGLSSGRWAHPSLQPLRARRARPGWHAYRPAAETALPPWAVEVTLTVEHPTAPPSGHQSQGPQALVLLRSASIGEAVTLAITDALVEVEQIAGFRRPEPDLHLVRSLPEPDLEPLAATVALRHLRRASQRGLGAWSWRRSFASLTATWEAGAGALVTCQGPAGLSAQAVISLYGRGDPRALRPPPGGAIVLRAWRPGHARRPGHRWRAGDAGPIADPIAGPIRHTTALMDAAPARYSRATWALATGLVLASANPMGLGRAAGRLAASVRAGGWDATVLTGPAALELARAGDPRQPVPRLAACWVAGDEIAATVAACLGWGPP